MVIAGDLNGQEFVTAFEELRMANKIHVKNYANLL
jgi:hypothetical protein